VSVGDLNETPRGSRLHIAIFGRSNAGKSSLINALTSQEIAIVSDIPGTTTDPVYKSMEISPIGPVVLIDTAGIDDTGELGSQRIKKTMEVLNKADLMLLVIDPSRQTGPYEKELLQKADQLGVPAVGVLNKTDLYQEAEPEEIERALGIKVIKVSSVTRSGIENLIEEIAKAVPKEMAVPTILGDLINPGETVVLVVPIDQAAPKGRLILPQVQTIREILDHQAMALVVKESELQKAFATLSAKPKLVVTDSKAFLQVDADTPRDIMMTSFSILFARYKGDLKALVAGAAAVDRLQPGDRVLVAEACTHHRVSDDIGTVEIPRLLRQKVGGELHFEWVSGHTLPADLRNYQLMIHCGACMINRKEMLHRIRQANSAGVPVVNYGVILAHMHGILRRALSPFPDLALHLATGHSAIEVNEVEH
jgi:[FeFe] hydrogenase H-cluster maturation GTPase HydF